MSKSLDDNIPYISIARTIVQLISFVVINYIALELIFNIDLSIFEESIGVYPFIQTPRDAWSTGAGILEFTLYSIGQGVVPYYLLGLLFLIILFTARFTCGWMCPVGFIQDLIGYLPKYQRKFKINTDKSLKKVKYYLLGTVFLIIMALGILRGVNLQSYNEFAANLGNFLNRPLAGFSLSEFLFYTLPQDIENVIETMSLEEMFATGWQITGFIFYSVVIALSIYYPRFYCRVLCPYGAASAFVSEYSLLHYSRNPVKCVGRKECGVCEDVCPLQIRILDEDFESFTGNGECNLCGRCREECPYNAIKLTFG